MNSVTKKSESFSADIVTVSTIKATLLIALLFFVFVPQIVWGFNYLHGSCSGCPSGGCLNAEPHRFSDSHIIMERLRNGFPDGFDKAIALKTAADRWNLLAPVQLTIVGSNSTTISGNNKVNEIGFDANEFPAGKTDTFARTRFYTVFKASGCEMVEADIYFNPLRESHAVEDAQHDPYDYSTSEGLKNLGRNMIATAVHEFGHVLGSSITTKNITSWGARQLM